jgi:branched-chain amino acid transport system permease protein
VHIIWGRAPVDYKIPQILDFTLFKIYSTSFPAYKGFMMLVSLLMLLGLWLMITRTRIGLIIQASITHPQMVEALGHNVTRVFMLVFGVGCGLAGLAGVIGGNAFVTEPSMAATLGSIVFVVIVLGGLGSLTGAFIASLLVLDLFAKIGFALQPGSPLHNFFSIKISQTAPVLPFVLMVLMLIFRPRGLMGTRES